ncbi:MAG: MmgE/PrpD family protein [Deltaproteobacteria bacterium]|nr:MmgE/PrpD family protein [Deltaproteobacteria bacterium]
MHITKQIVDFVVGTGYGAIPAKALDVAKTAIIDTLGVTLAGSQENSARICAALTREEGVKGESTVVGQGFKSSPALAAFVNGTAAHALDYDHSLPRLGQPTAALVPATLTLAEALGASGREWLEAYVIGFEVTAKLARSNPHHMSKGGWHSTGTLGSLGAAVACARLLKLDGNAVEVALGIASSMACGIVSNFGSMTKPLHAGLASRNGVLAAKLAHNGFTANSQVLEGANGFFDVFSRGLPFDPAPLDGLGISFDLGERGIRIKPYPCGGLTHSAVDALLEMRAKHHIMPDAVDRICAGVTSQTYGYILRHNPETGIQGKFSMPYILARALVDGRLGLDSFTDKAVQDSSVRKLAEKVQMELDLDLSEDKEDSQPSKVTIELKDGRSFSQRIDYPKGGRYVPLSPEEIRDKFVECARKAITEQSTNRVLAYLLDVQDLDALEPLCELLAGGIQK